MIEQVLWECGGVLAAPAIADAAIHKTMAFIAPKVVGGVLAPTPVGELGNVEMTQVSPTLLPLSGFVWSSAMFELLGTTALCSIPQKYCV